MTEHAGLQRLLIQNVRNIAHADLRELGAVNIFFGANGSGKTSLLEAIAFLATARSFRRTAIKYFIRHDQPQCAVYGERHYGKEQQIQLGVTRSRNGERAIKIQGESVLRLMDLASHLPFQLFHHKSFQVLEESPSARRQLLDWGVFHVEHQFRSLWLRLQRTVKQRNMLLRAQAPRAELTPWDKEMVYLAQALDACRRQHLEALTLEYLSQVQLLLPELTEQTLGIDYYPGWSRHLEFAEVLEQHRERDRQRGLTHHGPHRAHIQLLINEQPASELLSRGQLKWRGTACKLAQSQLLQKNRQVESLYLIDDLPSELDGEHLDHVCQALINSGAQLFISCIEKSALSTQFKSVNSRLFHVEHGKISLCK